MDQRYLAKSLDRSRLTLDLQSQIGMSANVCTGTPTETPLSAPARSPYFLDQSRAHNAIISRRGLEAWKKALAAAAPGTTMCFRNREKSPIESLQRAWEEKKRKDGAQNADSANPKRKSVSFLLVRTPASSIRRLYQRATSTEMSPSPLNVVNAAFTTGPPDKDQPVRTNFFKGQVAAQTVTSSEL